MKNPKLESLAPLIILLACGAMVNFAAADETVADDAKPNVIFMLTDDLGFSDVGCYGAKKVETPNIDRLAAEGLRFTHFHTGASICSPSRAAFLTGAYPQRSGMYMGINPKRDPHWYLGLNPDEITLAEQFKKQNYATYMVGKWHLGTEPEFLPRKQGFDHYYGMPCNFGHSSAFFDDDKEVFAKTPLDRLTKLYTERVTSIIRDQAKRGERFFLFYSHNYPHTPYAAGKDFKKSSKDGVRGDVMQELDWSVGQMMATLKESGIADNTIVVFTSDNGPTDNQYAKPYRGTKYVTSEGGHRVPFIFHWPAKIKSPVVSAAHITAMDLFPTLSAAIDAPLATDRIYDGENILPLLSGQGLKRADSEPFYYYNCENLQAIRLGQWKLHLPRDEKQIPFWDKNKAFTNLKKPVLYDLESDESELTDVADQHPEIVADIMKLAQPIRQELGEFMQRGSAQRPTGSLFPEVPVISHVKDWHTIDAATIQQIDAIRQQRHPGQGTKKPKARRNKKLGIAEQPPSVQAVEFLSDKTYADTSISQIGFGSCNKPKRDQAFWDVIRAKEPEIMLLLGDNHYGNVSNPTRLKKAYNQLAAIPQYNTFRQTIPTFPTWDNHDYGSKYPGRLHPHAEESEQLFLEHFSVDKQDARRSRKGIYGVWNFDEKPHRVQVIMLDLQRFRDPFKEGEGTEPFVPQPGKTLMGTEQWKWFEEQLKREAEVRIIGSGIQVLSNEHAWRRWGMFPDERERLLRVIGESSGTTVLLSGDRHRGEFSVMSLPDERPLFDLTASSFNACYPGEEKNSLRVGELIEQPHFGWLEIDWEENSVQAQLLSCDDAEPLLSNIISLTPASK